MANWQNKTHMVSNTYKQQDTHNNLLIRLKSWQYLPPQERHLAHPGGAHLVADGSPRPEPDLECSGPESNSSPLDRNPPSPPDTGNPDHASNVQELSHSVHWSTIHYTRGRGGVGEEPTAWRGERNTGLTLDTWKTGWTRPSVWGSLSRTATGLRTLVMRYGPMNLGASLREGTRRGRSLVESHTFWPHTYWGAGVLWRSAATLVRLEARAKTSLALLQVRRHRRTKAKADGTAASGSWAGKRGGW